MYFKALLIATLVAFLQFTSSGHPPFSVVVNTNGQAFFSDLTNIWMVDIDGSKQIILHHVHNHQLWLDRDDNLLGEDVQNTGDKYRHRVWRIDGEGKLSNVVEWTSGHPSDIGGITTIRNHRNESVILQRPERAIVVGRETKSPRTISLGSIKGYIHELAINPSGDIFVAVGSAVYRVADGQETIRHYADIEIDRTPAFHFVHDRHALMGMHATDSQVYVSVFAGQYVARIDEDRAVYEVQQSSGDWSPSGVTIDDRGNMWVLECSSSNQFRLSKTDSAGERTVF